jgi:hypothetical protein
MTHKNRPSTQEDKSAMDSRRPEKRAYKKPEFRSEKVFETMALACAKVAGGGPLCRGRRRSS